MVNVTPCKVRDTRKTKSSPFVMALQTAEEIEQQIEEPEDILQQDVRISPAEEMPGDGPGEEESDQLFLPWDRFCAWLHCICVVGFDLELGQAVEVRLTLN